MKRIRIGLVFLALILAVGAFLSLRFTGLHEPLAQGLEKAGEYAREELWPAAQNAMDKAVEAWQEHRAFVAAAADHEPLEELEGYLAQLKEYAKQKSEEFAPLAARVAELARAMGEAQMFTWWNLL